MSSHPNCKPAIQPAAPPQLWLIAKIEKDGSIHRWTLRLAHQSGAEREPQVGFGRTRDEALAGLLAAMGRIGDRHKAA